MLYYEGLEEVIFSKHELLSEEPNEVLFLLIWLFKILNIAFYGVMGSMANKSTMFSKQSLIEQRNKILIES